MKILVIGGSIGLGKAIVEKYNADQVSRSNGYPIPDKTQEVLDLSVNYDVIVNCIPDSNQNLILEKLFQLHHDKGLKTYFLTVGSMSHRLHSPGHSKKDLHDWNEKILTLKTSVKHTLLHPAYLWNSFDEGIAEPISKDEILNTIDFLITQGYNNKSNIAILEIKGPIKC